MVDVATIEIVRSQVQKVPLGSLENGKFPSVLRAVLRVLRQRGVSLPKDQAALIAAVSILAKDLNFTADGLMPHLVALLGLLARCTEVKHRTQTAIDCAIAYGAGWRRRALPTTPSRSLEEVWQPSIDLLNRRVGKALRTANHFLEGILYSVLGDHGEQFSEALKEGLSQVQFTLTWRLIVPEFAGEAHNFPLRIEGHDSYTELFAMERLRSLPAGARSVFSVSDGWVSASLNERLFSASKGDRFIVIAQDFGGALIRFPVGSNSGPHMRLKKGQSTVLSSVFGDATISRWHCGCGTWECPSRHRLDAWIPGVITLAEFVASAVNGRQAPLTPGSFVDGMYFAYLLRDTTRYEGTDFDAIPEDQNGLTFIDEEARVIGERYGVDGAARAHLRGSNRGATMPQIRRVLLVNSRDGGKTVSLNYIPVDRLRPAFEPAHVLYCGECDKYVQVAGDYEKPIVTCECGHSRSSSGLITAWWRVELPDVKRKVKGYDSEKRDDDFEDVQAVRKLDFNVNINHWLGNRLSQKNQVYVKLRLNDPETGEPIPGSLAKRKRLEEEMSLLREMTKVLEDPPTVGELAKAGVKRGFWTIDEIESVV